jgi:hypothetical protein
MKVTARNILSGTRQKFSFMNFMEFRHSKSDMSAETMLRSAGLGNCEAVIPMVRAGLL